MILPRTQRRSHRSALNFGRRLRLGFDLRLVLGKDRIRNSRIGRMNVSAGDLLHGDCYGVQTIPLEIAPQIPDVAREITRKKQELQKLCRSPEFTLDRIRAAVKDWKP